MHNVHICCLAILSTALEREKDRRQRDSLTELWFCTHTFVVKEVKWAKILFRSTKFLLHAPNCIPICLPKLVSLLWD
jgi:hypothetical protein